MKEKDIAIKRMFILYKNALKVLDQDRELAKRYIYLMWRIKLKYRIKTPKNLRNKFCKKCFIPWIPGKTLAIRIRKGRIIYRCLECGHVKRKPFKRKI